MWISKPGAVGRAVFAAAMMGTGAVAQDALIRPLDPGAEALNPYKWQNRPVLVFADSSEDETYRAALEQLEAAAPGLRERDIVVLTDADPARATALRGRLNPDGFAMYLVGKDGGVKLSAGEVISPDTLFETIDGMPMRQREMRED